MGGSKTATSGTKAKSKPPLPPKPAFVSVYNGVSKPMEQETFTEILLTEESKTDTTTDEHLKSRQYLNFEKKEQHESTTKNADGLSSERNMKSTVQERRLEKDNASDQIEHHSDSLRQTATSSTFSEKSDAKRTSSRGRPHRRISKPNIDNGESGDEACCIKFAGMIRNKAVDIASQSKILPPTKPPKPENLAKYKIKHRKGSQQDNSKTKSVGDNVSIDGSQHGVRFVDDDETESSTDYRDIDENSVFLLELACHSDFQTISKGESNIESTESGYYTSDVKEKDEEINIACNSSPISNDIKNTFETVENKTIVTNEDLTNDQTENTKISSPLIDDISNIKSVDINISEVFPSSGEISSENNKNVEICTSEVLKDNENQFPTVITDADLLNQTDTTSVVINSSIKKRVKSPPRPPPPKRPETVQKTTLPETEKTPVCDTELNKDTEIKSAIKEETIDSNFEQNEINLTPIEVPNSANIKDITTINEISNITTKKRVTSPPRPPPPKYVPSKKSEVVPNENETNRIDNNEISSTENMIDSKKYPPPVPVKPLRTKVPRHTIITVKSSLEPLDLSVKEDIGVPIKQVSLSPKTFPRSKKRGPMPLSPVKKIESTESARCDDKRILTTVVKNAYLEELQPLPSQKSPVQKRALFSKPSLPQLQDRDTDSSKDISIQDLNESNKADEQVSDDLNKCNDKLKSTDEHCLEENEVLSSESLITVIDSPESSKLENSKDAQPEKPEQPVDQSPFDRVQYSTWPIAVERKKSKMKSPPRPPPPEYNVLSKKDDSSLQMSPETTFNRQSYETSSLDSRGRKRIKSPPRPPPPQHEKLHRTKNVSYVSSPVLSDTTNKTPDKSGSSKRIKSPPRPPPPVYEKLPLKHISSDSSKPSDVSVHFQEPEIPDVLPSLEEKITVENSSPKRVISPPRPPPPVLEKIIEKSTEETTVISPVTNEIINETIVSSALPQNDESVIVSKDIGKTKKRVVSPPRPPRPIYEKLSSRKQETPIITGEEKKSNICESKISVEQSPVTDTAFVDRQLNRSSITSAALHEYEEIQPPSINDKFADINQKTPPKAPPRVKRNRSRTVEVVSLTEKPEERKRRSHSLTESDVIKKMEDRGLLNTPQRSEMKTLYTLVQKDRGKMIIQESDNNEEGSKTPSYDKMKFRPLPPPPPPPRARSRSSMSQSPANLGHNSVSEEMKADENQHDTSFDMISLNECEEMNILQCDENANISTSSYYTVTEQESEKEEESNFDDVLESLATNKAKDVKQCVFIPSKAEKHERLRRKSHSPPRTRSKSPSPTKQRSASSWYDDESDVSGDLGDVDTSVSSQKESTEGLNNYEDQEKDNSLTSKQKQTKSKADSSKKSISERNSKFYCEIEDSSEITPKENESIEYERPVSSSSFVEKSVQTSPERELCTSRQSKDDQSDDTDDILDRARTVQMELCLMLERRKRKKGHSLSGDNDTKSSCSYSPSPKCAPRHKIIDDISTSDHSHKIDSPQPTVSFVEKRQPLSSTRSSNSELSWQESSSEESESEQIERSVSLLEKKKKKKAFYIAKEIMTSEESFLSCLKLLNEEFKGVIEKANKERGGTVISEDIVNNFLQYFPQLQNLNENLLSELKDRIEHWDQTQKIADVIVKIGPFLKLYSSYIRDFDSMEAALDDARRKYPLFDQVTREFEASPICKKLAVKHYMLKPIQRIPQYRLLLQEYLQNLTEDSPDYSDTLSALQIVSEVANHANDTLRQGDNFQKLVSIQNSIFGPHEIVRPGRVFLKEGELMKLSRKDMQPRWFILFNDSLFYLTCMQQGLYKVNHELPLTGMKVHIPQNQDYKNEFSIISVTRSVTLAARSVEERQEWVDSLNKAIEENACKRSTFTNVMIQQKGEDEQTGTFILGKQAPVWIPDGRVTMCQLCTREFTVTFRRHHCRACGKVMCSICSANKAPLQYRHFQSARVCDECFEKLQKEFEATEPTEKIFEGGETCTTSELGETDSDSSHVIASIKAQFKGNAKTGDKKTKRHLPSVLKEVCANDQGSTISGYLYRRNRKGWKQFWFVLKDKVLYTYKASEDVAALESIPLLGFTVETFIKPLENIEADLLFQLTHAGQSPIIFHTDSPTSTERWIHAMQDATVLE